MLDFGLFDAHQSEQRNTQSVIMREYHARGFLLFLWVRLVETTFEREAHEL